MKETPIQNAIRNELAGRALVFRANVGQAWVGDEKKLENGDVLLRGARPFKTGLPPGFSDLFGVQSVTITPEMVGTVIGQFVALEVKTERGRVSEPQERFLAAVKRAGGKSGVVRSVDDARAVLGLAA